MKRLLFIIVPLTFLLASCDVGSRDSKSNMTYAEYNLIVSDNPGVDAVATLATYSFEFNLSKGFVSMSTENLLFDNSNHSFETDTIPFVSGVISNGQQMFSIIEFSRNGNCGKTVPISDVKAEITKASYYTTDVNIPGIYTVSGVAERLILGYRYDNRYSVQTFRPECFYAGQTMSSPEGSPVINTTTPMYRVIMNLKENKAICVVYHPVVSGATSDPAAFVISDLNIRYSHNGYYIEASEPTFKIVKTSGSEPTEDPAIRLRDFRLSIVSPDLVTVQISYNLNSAQTLFQGSSVIQPSN